MAFGLEIEPYDVINELYLCVKNKWYLNYKIWIKVVNFRLQVSRENYFDISNIIWDIKLGKVNYGSVLIKIISKSCVLFYLWSSLFLSKAVYFLLFCWTLTSIRLHYIMNMLPQCQNYNIKSMIS